MASAQSSMSKCRVAVLHPKPVDALLAVGPAHARKAGVTTLESPANCPPETALTAHCRDLTECSLDKHGPAEPRAIDWSSPLDPFSSCCSCRSALSRLRSRPAVRNHIRRQNDKEGRFSSEAIKALGPAGLLGIMLPADVGGSALGPRTFAAVVATLAEADASVAMVYLMHVCATATIAAARKAATVAPTLKEIAAGRHLSTLAFSEAVRAAIFGHRSRGRDETRPGSTSRPRSPL